MKFDAVQFLHALYAAEQAGTALRVRQSPLSPANLPGDWWLEWDERAAIMEHEGGLPRDRAEALALADVLQQMRQAGTGFSPPT